MKVNIDPKRIVEFNTPRSENEIDLSDIVYKFIVSEIGQTAGDIFRSDPSIVDIIPRKPSAQKVVINNYLVNLLFKYRACGGEDITACLSLLSANTNIDGFVTLLTTYILPFIKANNVYGIYKKES